MTDQGSDAKVAVLLFQWDENCPDANEPAKIRKEIHDFLGSKAPEIICSTTRTDNTAEFLESLTDALADNDLLQLLYFSAHGNESGLSNAQKGGATVTYKQFGDALQSLSVGCVELVMGSCKALTEDSELLKELPANIYSVWGYQSKPAISEVVSLIVQRIRATRKFYEKCHAKNKEMCERINSGELELGLVGQWFHECTDASDMSDSSVVSGDVVWACRTPNGKWDVLIDEGEG